jgi:hypothetical protein
LEAGGLVEGAPKGLLAAGVADVVSIALEKGPAVAALLAAGADPNGFVFAGWGWPKGLVVAPAPAVAKGLDVAGLPKGLAAGWDVAGWPNGLAFCCA